MDHRARLAGISTGRRAALAAATLMLTLATAGLAAPSWRPLPPFGGTVVALAAAQGSSGLLYAGTLTAGALRSRDGGATWLLSEPVPGAARILTLEVDLRDPKVVFAAASLLTGESAGVLRSLDGGAHWRPANHGLGDDHPFHVMDLATDPFDPQKLYAGTDHGLYRTRDRGASWQQVDLAGSEVLSLAVHPFRPGELVATVFHPGRQIFELLASTDGGATWRLSNRGIEGNAAFSTLLFHPTSPDTLFALGNGWPTYVSRDGGATWTDIGQPLTSLAFGPAGSLLGSPYGADGVLKSTDGGLHWSPAGALPDRVTQLLAANGRLYAAGARGVWVSNDNGAHWRPSSRGLSAREVGDLTESGSVLYASFAEGALASGSGGTNWRPLEAGDPDPRNRIVRFLAAGPGVLYAQEAQGEFGRIAFVRSTDRGATWTEITDPELGGTFTSLAVDPRHPEVLYAGASENSGNDHPPCHLKRSTDGGHSWICLTLEASVDKIAVEPKTSTPYLILAGNLFILAGGTRIEFRGTGLPQDRTLDFAFDRETAGTLYAATTSGIFKTVNGGRTWSRSSRGLPAGAFVYSVAVDPLRKNVVYAGLTGKVYRSRDGGRTWSLLGDGLPADAPIKDLLASASNPHRLYAVAAGHGLFVQDPAVP